MEKPRDILIGWLANALKDRGIFIPHPQEIFDLLIESNFLADLWFPVFGELSPLSLPDRDSSRLITDLVNCLNVQDCDIQGLRIRDPKAKIINKNRARDRSQIRYRNNKKDRKKLREFETIFYITDNPRKFGNGKNDETYPEFYLYYKNGRNRR